MSDPVIVVDNLTFRYFGTREPIVVGTSFQVDRGEFVLILGPSGCGKSTLCLSLNGIIPQTLEGEYSGNVWIKGKPAKDTPVPELSQQVGIVFQDPESQFAMLTASDELAFAPENLNLPADEVRRRMQDAIDTVKIQHLVGKNVSDLSGGEKQRLALAASLTLQPEILVFDDVTANLDPVGTAMIFETLRELRSRDDRTIIVIEHKVDELVDLVDRVIVLDERSRVVASGTPREVFYNSDPGLLMGLGIWIPEVVDLSLRLQGNGFSALASEKPLTPVEASSALIQPGVSWDDEKLRNLKPTVNKERNAQKTSIFEVKDLSFRYEEQGQPALKGADLKIADGDFIAVVGPNGSGKTTLMKHLVGILTPPGETVYLGGKDLSDITFQELARRVGFVFQNPEHQIVTDNVYNELAYSLRRQHISESEIRRRVDDIAELFRLKDLLKKNPYMLSGGEKRRLGVATMLIVGQEVLILDEPTYGQDRLTARHLMSLLQDQHQQKRTIIMVTHDMKLVAEYARQVHVLWQGQTCFSGSPIELFQQTDLLAQTSLLPPPMFRLSKELQKSIPAFPDVVSVDGAYEIITGALR